MGDKYSVFSRYIDEQDFATRKTNLYAKVNGEYYMRVSRRIPEEISKINGVFNFHYCRIRKIGEHQFKEEAKSKEYIVTEEVMTGEDFLKICSVYDPLAIKIAMELEDYDELIVCINSYVDPDGKVHKFAAPLLDGEIQICKPKILRLIN
jgi:hypothetical protein